MQKPCGKFLFPVTTEQVVKPCSKASGGLQKVIGYFGLTALILIVGGLNMSVADIHEIIFDHLASYYIQTEKSKVDLNLAFSGCMMLSSSPKFDIATLQSLSINKCNGAAPRGICDICEVLEAINSIPGAHKQTNSEANLVLDLVRAKHDVFLAQKALADCVIQENEVFASLLKVRTAAAEKNIDETDIGLGCMRIIFKDHG
ncbi:uncharacterized protein HD556DRAFT_1309144 [Suillus plorans]|uniref:Uncharacterized protein n=1 Tax=Suillus plorans TaxID=116603 RepID=A0A9P7AMR0_9AGAM|nr:uncharacterized protein HD556DRAFT_1309144 [Suillus plorans]KAG1792584.1 hypothetical protein HD556DRAFT_1309144 [Suillus plorans]